MVRLECTDKFAYKATGVVRNSHKYYQNRVTIWKNKKKITEVWNKDATYKKKIKFFYLGPNFRRQLSTSSGK